MKKYAIVLLTLLISIAVPVMAFDTYPNIVVSTNEIEAVSGAPFTINVTLYNGGEKDAFDVRLSLSTGTDLILPTKQSTAYFNRIYSGKFSEAGFKMLSNVSIPSKIYPITFLLSYRDDDGRNYSSSTIVGIKIVSNEEKKEPEIGIFYVDTKPDAYATGTSTISFDVGNTGTEKAYGTTATVSFDQGILKRNSFYIGDLDNNDFQTIEIDATFNNITGTYPINVTVSYKDKDNNVFMKSSVYNINITPYNPTKTKSGNELLIVVVIIIIAIIVFYWKKRKK